MSGHQKILFSGPVSAFQDQRLPEPATPVGYSALIDAFGLSVPPPRTLVAIGSRHRVVEAEGWRILTPRHAPHPTLEGHLTFALKYEGLDLAVLKRLFLAVAPADIEAMVKATPSGTYVRRIWFLYEWLLRTRLDLPRCAREAVADVPRDILARTAAFLLLKDSKSSYAIEGERPPQDRIQRWGRAIGEAGLHPLDTENLLRLQAIVIGDARFVTLGVREEGGFIGEHDRETRLPLPVHISARPEDLPALMDGLIAFERGPAQALDPVIAAAVLAFGFVYIHPFEDGNGRLHRYLIHHVLAARGFNPPGVVFPVSAAILERIDDYRRVLEGTSARMLPLIRWETTPQFNVRVLNETGDHYRFFDATPHAEFLFACVRKTIEEDLPNETRFLRCYDRFRQDLQMLIDMPDRTVDLLFRFLHQNDGRLSKRAREREFAALSDPEVERIEGLYADLFDDRRDA